MSSACVLIRKMPGGPSKPVKILIPFVSQNRHRRIEEFLSLRRLRADPPQPRVVFLRKIGGGQRGRRSSQVPTSLAETRSESGLWKSGSRRPGTGVLPEVEFASEQFCAGRQGGRQQANLQNPSRSGWAGTQKTNKYNSYRQNRLLRNPLSNAGSEVGDFIEGPQHKEFQD